MYKKKLVSIGVRLIFQDQNKTLTKEEIDSEMKKLYEAIRKKGWLVRGVHI